MSAAGACRVASGHNGSAAVPAGAAELVAAAGTELTADCERGPTSQNWRYGLSGGTAAKQTTGSGDTIQHTPEPGRPQCYIGQAAASLQRSRRDTEIDGVIMMPIIPHNGNIVISRGKAPLSRELTAARASRIGSAREAAAADAGFIDRMSTGN